MKRFLLISCSVAALSFALGREMPGAEETPTVVKLPHAIQTFYEAHNYVVAFSTEDERRTLPAYEIECRRGDSFVIVKKRLLVKEEEKLIVEDLIKKLNCKTVEVKPSGRSNVRLEKIRSH